MKIRDHLRLSKKRQGELVRVMQVGLVGILIAGLWEGNTGIIVNAFVGLVVTQLPALLKRDYDITMDVGLVLWITTAMFLHAFGTLQIPGIIDLSAYKSVWWWDHMTHAMSSSLVAATAYATARAIDEYTEGLNLTPRFMFVYLLLFVMAFGVVWELIEFFVGEIGRLLATGKILTQYGLDDTVLDLFYNTMGALVVAIWGTAYLSGVSKQLSEKLSLRTAE
ncbi:hypothetical protein SAMN05421858_2040 [Haladaptatus litoreus]|uniref:Uncharacterized protein n=1 Tax=Haladaptatus litoreus TaxID=553468 RepID=A0A1N6ZI27_9EURY|nr:hypothetical protein [Haladaptatus litoreus]SIR26468.1 hypothetical protein SAMN05421858_2040 [Haladaptatus litoreus]